MESKPRQLKWILMAVAAMAIAGTAAFATLGSGTSSTVVGPATTYDPFKVKREPPDGWSIKLEAKEGVALATQVITFQPGGQSGWHTHPGPVFISVKEGTMTFYEDDCTSVVLTAGEGFLDTGSHAHLARNESGSPATNVVTYFIPPHTTTLRFDAPQPVDCRM